MALQSKIWAIRAGKKGVAHGLFLQESVVALEDSLMGNLLQIEKSRESFYSCYRKNHPKAKPEGVSGVAGKYFRFCYEIEPHDSVLYLSFSDKLFYFGTVVGEYYYVTTSHYPHQRKVKWLYAFDKRNLSIEAQYETGAARTFFEIKRNAEEIYKMANSPMAIAIKICEGIESI
jgi:predicted Mrr-cat superfamily restriction endonuclease